MTKNFHEGYAAHAGGVRASAALSFGQLIDAHADSKSGKNVFRFLENGEEESACWDWLELQSRVRGVAQLLRDAGAVNQRVILLFPQGLDFVAAFLGCLYCGAVAIPAYPPLGRRGRTRLASILEDARPEVILTSTGLRDRIYTWIGTTGVERPRRWLAVDGDKPPRGTAGVEPESDLDRLAFLQYTSGSTSEPKGVMVSHRNLLANEGMIQEAFRQSEASVVVSWLPQYHDMGLIGGILQPLYCGGQAILMSPASFLQKPGRWLEAISRYRADTSGAPNFAYELCTRRVEPDGPGALDLSSWKVAFNGAEPIRSETLEAFRQKFASWGFDSRAFLPCYGLAEGTLLVAGRSRSREPMSRFVAAEALESGRLREAGGEERTLLLTSSGPVMPELDVRIVAPESSEVVAEGRIGEIWVRGETIAQGYWKRPEQTCESFGGFLASGEGPFLRTGDLGALWQGGLWVTGRLKDLIIVRGRNHYPQDLESTAEAAHPALRAGSGAAFAVEGPEGERLVIAQELNRHSSGDPEAIGQAVRAAVAEDHLLQVHEVVLLRYGALPKTTSGKVQRAECRRRYIEDALETVGRSRAVETLEDGMDQPLDREGFFALPADERSSRLEAFLRGRIARALRTGPAQVALDVPITRLGLDSLAAIELQHAVEEETGIALSVSTLLSGLTVRELAQEALERPRVGEPSQSEAPMVVEEEPGALSYGQRALYFLQKLAPQSSAYNLGAAVRILGSVDGEALERAFSKLVDRHAVLREAFEDQEEGIRRVESSERPRLVFRSWVGGGDEALRRQLSDEVYRPFDLATGPLYRAWLWRGDESGQAVLAMAAHHIVCDFWSLTLLLREWTLLYAEEVGATGGGVGRRAPVDGSYGEYVVSEARRLNSPRGQRLDAFWRQRLEGELPVLDLLPDRPRPAVQGQRGEQLRVAWPTALTDDLVALGQRRDATLYAVLLSLYQALLCRYTGQDRVLVGSPSAGRTDPRWDRVVGYFVNPVVLGADFGEDPAFLDFLATNQEEVLAVLEHQAYPFALLTERIAPHRDASRPPIFQTLFSWQAAPSFVPPQVAALALEEPDVRFEIAGLEMTTLSLETRFSQFELSLHAARLEAQGGGLVLRFTYDPDLYDRTTVERLAGHLHQLAAAVVVAPKTSVRALPMLSRTERDQLLAEWNETRAPFPAERPVHVWFEERVAEHPDAVAVVWGQEETSYQDLNRKAAEVAARLQALGVEAGSLVAVFLDVSPDRLAALLGIWKVGAAYVPLDPQWPRERLSWMLEDSGASVVVTTGERGSELPSGRIRQLWLDGAPRSPAFSSPASPPFPSSQRLAYTIYTSGSTGKPKGVQVSHRALSNFLNAMGRRFGVDASSVVISLTSLSFDIAGLELFLPLTQGARSILVPQGVAADGVRLRGLLESSGATMVQATPATWKLLLEAGWSAQDGIDLLCGGEEMPRELARRLLQQHGRLWNLYGPTETTIWSTVHRVREGDLGSAIPIGIPIDNTRIYILDTQQEPVPVGVEGDLFIGGEGLAWGYRGRPALTAWHFVPDAATVEGGQRMYRTGDRARWRSDGLLEFRGRRDHQVKIRGHRIELGEIEACLVRHSEVREAVAGVRRDGAGDPVLMAWWVPTTKESATAADLKNFLRRQLPETMVPNHFMALPELPLTANGKVDRRRLPALEMEREPGSGTAPEGPVATLVASLFQQLLGRESVALEEDFFVLGGHSLKAAQLAARLRRAFDVEIPLSRIFRDPTVAGVTAAVEDTRRGPDLGGGVVLEAVPRDGGLPVSFGQQRLWFFDQVSPDSTAYLMACSARLSGPLHPELLEQALGEVVARHEVLRTRFEAVEEGVQQYPQDFAADHFEWRRRLDLSGLGAGAEPEAARLVQREAQRPLAPGRIPLLRATLLRLGPEEHRLILVTQHIAADAWSLGIFFEELAAIYTALRESSPSPLLPLPVQYGDFAAWQRRRLQEGAAASVLEAWQQELADITVLELPIDRPRPPVQGYRGRVTRRPMVGPGSARLRALGQHLRATPFMILAAAFHALLGRLTGHSDPLVGVPFAQRDLPELEGLIGFFVNTLPMRVDLGGRPSLATLVERMRRAILNGHERREVPLELLLETLSVERDLSRNPLFQVTFSEATSFPEFRLPELQTTLEEAHSGSAKFDLSLTVAAAQDPLVVAVEYNRELFDHTTLERWLGHYEVLLEAALKDPDLPFEELPVLAAAECHQIQVEWNDTATLGLETLLVHQQVERWAEEHPEAPAVVCGEETLTYGVLVSRARRWAANLRGRGVGPEVPVGLWLERGLDWMVAQLGILMAGGAYLAIDPNTPEQRVTTMLEVARSPLLLTSRREALPGDPAVRLVNPEDLDTTDPGSAATRTEDAAHLAYVIFTSGSTGMPKGVAISHRGLANLVGWHQRRYGISREHRATALAGLGFDASVWEVWPYLTAGATLYLVPNDWLTDPPLLAERMGRWGITHCFLPTPLAEAMLPVLKDDDLPLEAVFTGGERLHGRPSEGRPWALFNHYGPTEVSVVTTSAPVAAGVTGLPPIGRPIANLGTYVLDAGLRPVPPGVAGELHIGGLGLARGYLRQPAVTAMRFLPNPFTGCVGDRMYRTGDRVRLRGDGLLEFLDRVDQQVKVRGHRIELGEVEAVLRRHPLAREAVVLALSKGSELRLIAYVTFSAGAQREGLDTEMREWLGQYLPAYMVPSRFVLLERMPCNASGKVDRKALPKLGNPEPGEPSYAAPRSDLERELVEVWGELLGRPRVGVFDDFFALGGHSLQVARLMTRIQEEFGVRISPRSLFEGPTVVALSRTIAQAMLEQEDRDLLDEISPEHGRGQR